MLGSLTFSVNVNSHCLLKCLSLVRKAHHGLFFAVLVIELRVSNVLGKCSVTEVIFRC